MIKRTFDPTFLNEVCNHPEVKPWVTLNDEFVDVTELLKNPRNVALVTDGGGFICVWQEPGVYEVHTQFLPDYRGAAALQAAREGFDWMFLRTDAEIIQTRVAYSNEKADKFTQLCGFQLDFERERAWGEEPMRYFSIDTAQWLRRNQTALARKGEEFHKLLVEKGGAVDHVDDLAHDAAVGAAVSMFQHGQVQKAVVWYNRWARFAGYEPVTVLNISPLVVNIKSALIALTPVGFDVLPLEK